MAKNELIRDAIEAKIRAIVGADPKIYPQHELGADETNWPGYLRLASGTVHGYVIFWVDAVQDRAATIGAGENQWLFEIRAFHSQTDPASVNTFTGYLEEIMFSMRPESYLELAGGSHVRVGIFRWKHATRTPTGELLQYSVGTVQVKFREC